MITLDGPIDAVTLYRSAAVVTRRATTALAAGDHDVEIVGLPLSLVDGSVRVRAEADGGHVDVAQVRIALYVAPRDALEDPPDELELKRLRRQIASLKLQSDRLQFEQLSLGGMQTPERPELPEGQAPAPSPLAARLALEAFVSDGVQSRSRALEAIAQQRRDLQRECDDLQQRVDLASSARQVSAQEVTKSVICRVRAATDVTQAKLTVEYRVDGPRWVPSYQVRVSEEHAEIVLRAMVAQKTGEDWSGVSVHVSTADPVSWTALPQKTALRIGRKQAFADADPYRPPPEGADALFADYDAQRQQLSAPTAPVFDGPVMRPLPLSVDFSPPVAGGAAMDAFDDDDKPTDMDTLEMVQMAARVAAAPPTPKRRRKGRGLDPGARLGRRREASIEGEPVVQFAMARGGLMEKSMMTFGGAGAGEPPAAFTTAPRYDALALAGPDEPDRGTLRHRDPVRYFKETAERSGRTLAFDVERLIANAAGASVSVARVAIPDKAEPPDRSSGRFDYTYSGLSPVDIPSDGAFHSIPLSVRTCPCALTYVTVPRMDPSVYRQARLSNPDASPLLPGPAEIYVDGEYVLTATMPIVPGQGTFELGLGVEQAIRCARNVRFVEARSSDKVVATNDLYHELRFTLANDLDRDVRCEVRERVPIPGEDAEVVVEERDVDPPWQTYTQAERKTRIQGGRRWVVSIGPRQEAKLKATYVIRIYANHQVAGGNRRER